MAPTIKVLVVDDSALARGLISRRLASDPGIEVVGTASDGVEAFERVKALRPDVVTLDVQMPVMDGLAALQKIMSSVPTPVVMLSSLTGDDSDTTIRALELGAIDFFLKPSSVSPGGLDGGAKDLVSSAARKRTTGAEQKWATGSAIGAEGWPVSAMRLGFGRRAAGR